MTRAEARIVATELHRLIRADIIEHLNKAVSESLDRVLNVAQAAEYLGCKPKTIYNNISQIPHYHDGRHLRFSEKGLKEYMKERCRMQ